MLMTSRNRDLLYFSRRLFSWLWAKCLGCEMVECQNNKTKQNEKKTTQNEEWFSRRFKITAKTNVSETFVLMVGKI